MSDEAVLRIVVQDEGSVNPDASSVDQDTAPPPASLSSAYQSSPQSHFYQPQAQPTAPQSSARAPSAPSVLFEPAEEARKMRESEIKREQIKLAYEGMYENSSKASKTFDTIVDVATKMRGTLGGAFGPMAGAVLDVIAAVKAIKPEDTSVRREAQRRNDELKEYQANEPADVQTPALNQRSINPPVVQAVDDSTPATLPAPKASVSTDVQASVKQSQAVLDMAAEALRAVGHTRLEADNMLATLLQGTTQTFNDVGEVLQAIYKKETKQPAENAAPGTVPDRSPSIETPDVPPALRNDIQSVEIAKDTQLPSRTPSAQRQDDRSPERETPATPNLDRRSIGLTAERSADERAPSTEPREFTRRDDGNAVDTVPGQPTPERIYTPTDEPPDGVQRPRPETQERATSPRLPSIERQPSSEQRTAPDAQRQPHADVVPGRVLFDLMARLNPATPDVQPRATERTIERVERAEQRTERVEQPVIQPEISVDSPPGEPPPGEPPATPSVLAPQPAVMTPSVLAPQPAVMTPSITVEAPPTQQADATATTPAPTTASAERPPSILGRERADQADPWALESTQQQVLDALTGAAPQPQDVRASQATPTVRTTEQPPTAPQAETIAPATEVPPATPASATPMALPAPSEQPQTPTAPRLELPTPDRSLTTTQPPAATPAPSTPSTRTAPTTAIAGSPPPVARAVPPVAPSMANTASAASPGVSNAAATAGGSSMAGMASMASQIAGPAAVAMAGLEVLKAVRDTSMSAVRSIGDVATAAANPDADAAGSVAMLGDGVKAVSDKLFYISPVVGIFGSVVGEATTSVAKFMGAVNATAARYGEYSPQIAQAQAIAEINQTMGDLRRAQSAGPELARYIQMQGELQQKFEDIKIKVLMKILPLVTSVVGILDRLSPAADTIGAGIDALAAPITVVADAAEAIRNMIGDATREEPTDPTDMIFANPNNQAPGVVGPPTQNQGQGVQVPQL